jgi:hypothetical protein
MIKKIVLISLAVTLIAFALGTSPLQARAAGSTWHFSFAGKGAEAGFTTCDYWPVPAGTICTDTYISVAEEVYKEDGTQYPSTTMWVNQYSYKFDKWGNWIFVSDSWGGGEASLSIDRKLSNATASATLQMTTCTVDRRGNYTCQDSQVPVSATWSGVGDIVRTTGNSHTVSKGYTYNSHFKGSYRDASAQVSGFEIGTQMWASIYNSRWMDVYVSHGGW